MMLRLFMICVLAVAGGCAPSADQVAGTYSGTLNGASEALRLSKDGTFVQRVSLPSGALLTNDGTWQLQHRAVDLSGYLHFYSEEKNGALVPPERVAGIIYVYKGGMLVRDWDTGYYTLKHD
jgi:hypothetical protein